LRGPEIVQNIGHVAVYLCSPRYSMFSKPLSSLLVLVGIAVAAIQHRAQDSDSFSVNFAENQASLRYSLQPEDVPDVANVWFDIPFGEDSPESKFEPVRDLSAVRSDKWTTLRHPVFPRYNVRIKQSHFCDTTVR
jgi:hypothetical protein